MILGFRDSILEVSVSPDSQGLFIRIAWDREEYVVVGPITIEIQDVADG